MFGERESSEYGRKAENNFVCRLSEKSAYSAISSRSILVFSLVRSNFRCIRIIRLSSDTRSTSISTTSGLDFECFVVRFALCEGQTYEEKKN
ncbi:hypothetical protein L596_003695 [Steinernema carpocapsae]|uniref:Uncharacterized protein n=1 Tax=Steinernema carpocapsae TaxID=34508 RepID=A0A4U8UTE8_STECR|nr:hypothetical protein L596_003695 [Steinernema carpocapsae]